jgi:hypothetical protein
VRAKVIFDERRNKIVSMVLFRLHSKVELDVNLLWGANSQSSGDGSFENSVAVSFPGIVSQVRFRR